MCSQSYNSILYTGVKMNLRDLNLEFCLSLPGKYGTFWAEMETDNE